MKHSNQSRVSVVCLVVFLAFGSREPFAYTQAKPDALLAIDLNRIAVVERVVEQWRGELGGMSAETLRSKLMLLRADGLMSASLSGSFDAVLEQLNAMQSAASPTRALDAAHAGVNDAASLERLIQRMSLDDKHIKAIGELDKDLVYTPIAPCNLMDTRSGVSPAPPEGGPALVAGYAIRAVQVTGRCTVPAGAKGIAALYTIENNPSTGGVVFAGDAGGAGGVVVSWSAPSQYSSGSSITPLSTAGAMQLQSAGRTHIKVDITGYFLPPTRDGDGLRVVQNLGSFQNAPNVTNGSASNVAGGPSIQGATVAGGGHSGSACADGVGGSRNCGNQASGAFSAIGGGLNNRATGASSTVVGGSDNLASGDNSLAIGRGALARNHAEFSHAGGAIANSAGVSPRLAQTSRRVLSFRSTDASVNELRSGGLLLTPENRLRFFPQQHALLKATVFAKAEGQANTKAWSLACSVVTDSSGVVTLSPSPCVPTLVQEHPAASAWSLSITTETLSSMGFVKLIQTGQVGTNILWSVSVELTELHEQAANLGVAPATLLAVGDIARCPAGVAIDQTLPARTARLAMAFPSDTAVVTLGDNVYEVASASEFQNCYHPTWGPLRERTWATPGNHDYSTANATPYFDYFGARAGPTRNGYYSVDIGKWRLFSLNSQAPAGPGSAQMIWLQAELAKGTPACVLATWHYPRYSTGLHGSMTEMQEIWRTLHNAKADIVLQGHDHTYERFGKKNADNALDATGIRSFVVGTGGANAYPFNPTPEVGSEVRITGKYGVMRLHLFDDKYRWEFVDIDGNVLDQGEDQCRV